MQKPGFWQFLAAYMIDFLLLGLVGLVVGYLVMWILMLYIITLSSGGDWAFVGGCITFMIVVLLYFSILESLFGKTLGKKLMGLQVVQTVPQKQEETK